MKEEHSIWRVVFQQTIPYKSMVLRGSTLFIANNDANTIWMVGITASIKTDPPTVDLSSWKMQNDILYFLGMHTKMFKKLNNVRNLYLHQSSFAQDLQCCGDNLLWITFDKNGRSLQICEADTVSMCTVTETTVKKTKVAWPVSLQNYIPCFENKISMMMMWESTCILFWAQNITSDDKKQVVYTFTKSEERNQTCNLMEIQDGEHITQLGATQNPTVILLLNVKGQHAHMQCTSDLPELQEESTLQ